MKKFLLFLTLCWSVVAMAQDVLPYALVKQDAMVEYVLTRGEKKKLNMGPCYYRISVTDVSLTEDKSQNITYRLDMLDKKKNISSYSQASGTKDGFYNAILVAPDGSYKMDQDILFGIGQDMARAGFMFIVPGKMSVSQTLEGGAVQQEYKVMGSSVKSNYEYKNVKVVGEEDITVPAGTYHCMVIEGTAVGNLNKDRIVLPFKMWMARGIGVVRYRADFGIILYAELNDTVNL